MDPGISPALTAAALAGLMAVLPDRAALYCGGRRAAIVAAGVVGLAALGGFYETVRFGQGLTGPADQDMASWRKLPLFLVLMAVENSPRARQLLGHRRLQPEALTSGWMTTGHDGRRSSAGQVVSKGLIVTLDSLVSSVAMLMLLWLVYYLLARPVALRLPGVDNLADAAALGWPALCQALGLRLVVVLVTFAVVFVPGTNGSARWVGGSRIPRVAACWVLVGLVAVAAVRGGAIPWNWVVAGSVAALSASNLVLSLGVYCLFLHAIGVLG